MNGCRHDNCRGEVEGEMRPRYIYFLPDGFSRYPRLMDLVPAYPSMSSSKLRFVSKAEYPARGTERKMS